MANGRGGLVGAGVASPEPMVARLSDDNDNGMSVARSGSGGAENRSEKPPPDLTGGASCAGLVSFSGSGAGEGGLAGGGGGLAGGGLGLGGGPAGLGGFVSSFTSCGSCLGGGGLLAGGGGLLGGAAGLEGGGGLAGAESRLSVTSFSSSKLSLDNVFNSLADSFLN